jgi:hypothetical protein
VDRTRKSSSTINASTEALADGGNKGEEGEGSTELPSAHDVLSYGFFVKIRT